MKLDTARLATLDVCFAFQRPDVDDFLAETDADQFSEWQAYFALRPHGWQAIQMVVRRLTWAIFQRGRSKKDSLNEKSFGLMTGAEAAPTPELQRMRDEMWAAKWDARAISDAREVQKRLTDG